MHKDLLKQKEKELQGRITLLTEKEQEILAHKQRCVILVDSIENAIAAFQLEVGKEYEYSMDKVTTLMKIAQNLQQQVEYMQARKIPSTPPEVLEERRRAGSEAAEKIREGEGLCAESADVVAIIRGALLEDETAEQIKQRAREADEKISAAKVEMRKFPLQKKVSKSAEIKRL